MSEKHELWRIVDTLTQEQHEAVRFADIWISFWMMAQQHAADQHQQMQCAQEIAAWSKIRATTVATYQGLINAVLMGDINDLSEIANRPTLRH